MKTDTKYSTTVISSCSRFFGAMLTLALMASAVAFSQATVVNLGTAGSFGILAGAAITGATVVTGNVGTITGGVAAGVTVANGYTIYSDNAAVVQTAQTNLATAYNDAATRTGATPLAGNLSLAGTLAPGVYSITGDATIPTTVTLNGAGVYIFQITGSLTTSATNSVTLGGAVWTNIFWQVGNFAALSAGSTFEGTVMANNYITVGAGGAIVHGRLLSKTAYVTAAAATVGGSEIPLPVELVSFTATANRMNANLQWSTATEVNNYGFEIQRRQNADWSKVAFVSGAGTTNAPRDYSYTDNNLTSGRYTYRLKQVDNNGAFSYHGSVEVAIAGTAPAVFGLSQNYPNPFNPSTQIQYSLQNASQVSLKVYNVLGNEVATLVNGRQEAGSYTVPFNTNKVTPSLSSGVYLYRLEAGSFVSTKRLILMK